MAANKEINITSRYTSLQKHSLPGDFKFVLLQKALSADNELSLKENFILKMYFLIDRMALSDKKAFGLNTSDVIIETVPLLISPTSGINMQRTAFNKLKSV